MHARRATEQLAMIESQFLLDIPTERTVGRLSGGLLLFLLEQHPKFGLQHGERGERARGVKPALCALRPHKTRRRRRLRAQETSSNIVVRAPQTPEYSKNNRGRGDGCVLAGLAFGVVTRWANDPSTISCFGIRLGIAVRVQVLVNASNDPLWGLVCRGLAAPSTLDLGLLTCHGLFPQVIVHRPDHPERRPK